MVDLVGTQNFMVLQDVDVFDGQLLLLVRSGGFVLIQCSFFERNTLLLEPPVVK
jgi:hypothetical protein